MMTAFFYPGIVVLATVWFMVGLFFAGIITGGPKEIRRLKPMAKELHWKWHDHPSWSVFIIVTISGPFAWLWIPAYLLYCLVSPLWTKQPLVIYLN